MLKINRYFPWTQFQLSCTLGCLLLFISCQQTETTALEQALASDHPAIATVIQNPSSYELQIIYTEIENDTNGTIQFIDHKYQLNTNNYFYPASTVKLPAAILALEHLQNYATINAKTNYRISRDTLEHSIEDDVRQIFAVSDNEAYNRLYEFLGRDRINAMLLDKDIVPVQISHRLSTKDAANIKHQKLQFRLGKDTLVLQADPAEPIRPLTLQNTRKGIGYMKEGVLISEAMDFSKKNYFPLIAQHELMKRLFFENNYDENNRFSLSEENKNLLLHHMKTVPRENGYDENTYYDGYGKFFMFGDTKERIPEHIQIYNKVGYAYGTLTETAFIFDTLHDIQFLLSATILVNENGVFNDDTYEFDEVGIPFLAQLGREIYESELKQRE